MTKTRQNKRRRRDVDRPADGSRASRGTRALIWISFLGLIGYLLLNQHEFRAEWQIRSARQAIQDGLHEQALESLAAAHELDPSNGQTEYLQARVYRKLGQLDRMRDHLQAAHDLGFDTDLLRMEQWLANAQSGQMSIAEPHLNDLLLAPQLDGSEVCEAFVNGYLRNYNVAKALPLLEAWMKDYPEDERPHYVLGSYFHELGDHPQAEEHYRHALKLASGSSAIRSSLAASLIGQQQFDEAEQLLTANLESEPENLQFRIEWAEYLWKKGESREAYEEYRRLLQQSPDHERIRWGVARWLVQENRFEEALEYLEPLTQQAPYDEEYRRAFARALQSVDRTEEAKQHYEWIAESTEERLKIKPLKKKLKADPDNPNLRYELGRIYLHFESPELGVQFLTGVLDLDPQHTDAREELYEFYQQQGMVEMANRFRKFSQTQ